ncbi:MAG: hypothetical protein MHPSP_002928, partial [Paramarteilia canceri]
DLRELLTYAQLNEPEMKIKSFLLKSIVSSETLNRIIINHPTDERIIYRSLKLINHLIDIDVYAELNDDENSFSIFRAILQEMQKYKT